MQTQYIKSVTFLHTSKGRNGKTKLILNAITSKGKKHICINLTKNMYTVF